MAQHYHFAIATDWEYDWDYIRLLERLSQEGGLNTYVIWPINLDETLADVQNGTITFGYYYDRASDTSPEFLELQHIMIQKNIPVFDKYQTIKWAADKAIMHTEFITGGINTPFTVILPSYKTERNIDIPEEEFAQLGSPFIAKPANTIGGGKGVVKQMRTFEDILKARETFPGEPYLLQKKIIPLEQDNHRFWFRGFFTCGVVQAAWWNDLTHIYHMITDEEIERYQLSPLFQVVKQIGRVCKVNFFSTEIAMDREGRFIAIDYVNEVCDMRFKSHHFDGVPDKIIKNAANRIVEYVKEFLNE